MKAFSAVGIVLQPFLLAACNEATPSTDARTQPALVRVGTVSTSVQAERSFTGIVAARVQSDLAFRVPGKVLERLVDTGQTVKRGQPLMRIDATDLGLASRAREEAVAAAKALARQTAEDEARDRSLVSAGAVSASAYDSAKAAAEAARAELNAAQAQADVARNELGYAVLFADEDGVVVETLAKPGQVVGAGQIVARVAHAGRREAIVELPETLRPSIGSTGHATLYGNAFTGTAKLRQLSNAANRQTRTFEARYVLDDDLASAPDGARSDAGLHPAHSFRVLGNAGVHLDRWHLRRDRAHSAVLAGVVCHLVQDQTGTRRASRCRNSYRVRHGLTNKRSCSRSTHHHPILETYHETPFTFDSHDSRHDCSYC